MGPGLSSSTKQRLLKDWQFPASPPTHFWITSSFCIRKAVFGLRLSFSLLFLLAIVTEDQHLNIFSLRKSISEQVIYKYLLSEVFFNLTVQRILIMDETKCLTHKQSLMDGEQFPLEEKTKPWRKTRQQEYLIVLGVSLPLHKKTNRQ